MNTEARQQFRKRLADVSETELIQRLYLIGLVARIEHELLAYHALFSPESELAPGPDEQVAGIQLMLAQELIKRRSAKATRGAQHANHAQNGNH